MERHLRLAEARGSLAAPNNLVQDRALEMLLVLRQIEKEQERGFHLKLALVAHGPFNEERAQALLPEYFPRNPYQEAYTPDGEFDIDKVDDASLDWKVPSSPQEDEDISAWIMARERQMSLAELDEGWM